MNNILVLKDVCKTYHSGKTHQIKVLDGLNLAIKTGEVVGLLAPSGAGKSTLLHIAGLLDSPDSGRIFINGADYSALSDRRRTQARRGDVGFVYQFHHLLPEFSALENVVLPQLVMGTGARQARERALDLLNRVGVAKRAHHRPAELSGGEQQRVAFCRALANAPSVLLADEPTGNLDPQTSAAVFDALMGLVRETGMAALIATHNIALSKQMNRVLRLDNGKVISD
ncbi:MAG: ABC transporter ATP-binding protein [Candidatus Halichondribacter symbioticus]